MMEPYETEDMGVIGQPENEEGIGGEQLDSAAATPENDLPVEEGHKEGAAPEAAPDVEAPPKRKRTSRKKTPEPEPKEEIPVEPGPEPFPGPEAGTSVEAVGEGPELPADSLDDALDAPVGEDNLTEADVLVMSLAQEEETEPPETGDPDTEPAPGDNALPAARTGERASRPRENRPAAGHAPLTSLNLNDLDRRLSRAERQEWNDIYASFRSKSILTGEIMGVDSYPFNTRNRQNGILERRWVNCAVVIAYRVRILIPETEFWMPGEERPSHVFRNLTGAQIDYVILDVDRLGGVAVASRRMGAAIRRHAFSQERGGHQPGERLTCRVLTVGPTRCLLECNGYDQTLDRREMTHSSIYDLRTKFRRSDELDCVLTAYDRAAGRMLFSVREAEPDPFDGIENRHPLGSRRQGTITGKYGGGVFCTLPDGTTVLCLYTAQHSDRDFCAEDKVMLVIVKHDTDRRLVYGRILSKW